MVLQISDSNFNDILNTSQPVLVEFGAVWCNPYRELAATMAILNTEYAGRAVIAEIDIDQNTDIALKYNVISIPTILLFKGGQVVERFYVGVTQVMLETALNNYLSSSTN